MYIITLQPLCSIEKNRSLMAIPLPQPSSFPSSPRDLIKPTLTWNSIVAASSHAASPPPILFSSASGRRSGRDVWRRRNPGNHHYLDRSVDMDALLLALSQTTTPEELHAVMSPYLGTPDGRHQLSPRFMVSLLSREADWRRSLALLDWMLDVASYRPSVFAFNVVLRNALRARQFPLALGLLHEMRLSLSLSPDAVTYSTLVSALGQAGHLDAALSLLPLLDADGVSPDLPLLTTLIDLARKLGDHSKALSIFSRLRRTRIRPDLIAFNSALAALASAGLLRDARRLLFDEMPAAGVAPDAVSYSTLLAALVRRRRYLESLSLFNDMRSRRAPLDLTTCNVMLDAYGQLDMAREADRLFWSMRRLGISPSVKKTPRSSSAEIFPSPSASKTAKASRSSAPAGGPKADPMAPNSSKLMHPSPSRSTSATIDTTSSSVGGSAPPRRRRTASSSCGVILPSPSRSKTAKRSETEEEVGERRQRSSDPATKAGFPGGRRTERGVERRREEVDSSEEEVVAVDAKEASLLRVIERLFFSFEYLFKEPKKAPTESFMAS